jgi:hypothetical protein
MMLLIQVKYVLLYQLWSQHYRKTIKQKFQELIISSRQFELYLNVFSNDVWQSIKQLLS